MALMGNDACQSLGCKSDVQVLFKLQGSDTSWSSCNPAGLVAPSQDHDRDVATLFIPLHGPAAQEPPASLSSHGDVISLVTCRISPPTVLHERFVTQQICAFRCDVYPLLQAGQQNSSLQVVSQMYQEWYSGRD